MPDLNRNENCGLERRRVRPDDARHILLILIENPKRWGVHAELWLRVPVERIGAIGSQTHPHRARNVGAATLSIEPEPARKSDRADLRYSLLSVQFWSLCELQKAPSGIRRISGSRPFGQNSWR